MRNISQAGLAKLASRYGNEPITIIEVDWVDGSTAVYADRTIGDIPGRIVEVGNLDNAVNVNGNGSDGQSTGGSTASQELAITLDDTDGSVKAIFDRQDVHKRPARVYQYFSGLDLADKFLLFSGKINTPISWSERDRTVKFTILSQLEDLEIGFSAEEGQFPYLPSDLVGKTWPMVFGTAVNYQALQINKAVKGTTLAGVGVLSGMDLWSALPDGADDGQFKLSLLMMLIQINHLKKVKECSAPRSIRRWMRRRRRPFRSRSTRSNRRSIRRWPNKPSKWPAPWPAATCKSTTPTPTAWARTPSASSVARTFHRTRPSPSTSTTPCSPGTSRRTCSISTAVCIRPTTPRPPPPLPAKPRSRPSVSRRPR